MAQKKKPVKKKPSSKKGDAFRKKAKANVGRLSLSGSPLMTTTAKKKTTRKKK